MNITESLTVLKMELTQKVIPQIIDLLTASCAEGRPVHALEEDLWDVWLGPKPISEDMRKALVGRMDALAR